MKLKFNEVVLEDSHAHSLSSEIALELQRHSGGVKKPGVFTVWPFAEKVC